MSRWKSSGSRGKHQTVHRDARRAVAWLDTQDEIKKVVLGPYKPGGGRGGRRPGCLVFRSECSAGLRVYATTGDGVLELTLLVDPPGRPALLVKLADRWPEYAERVPEPAAGPDNFAGGHLRS